jgi:hypothetical protein
MAARLMAAGKPGGAADGGPLLPGPPQHTALRLLVSGDIVAVQPAAAGGGAAGAAVQTLSVALSSGQVRAASGAARARAGRVSACRLQAAGCPPARC